MPDSLLPLGRFFKPTLKLLSLPIVGKAMRDARDKVGRIVLIDAKPLDLDRQRRTFPGHQAKRAMQLHIVARPICLDGFGRDPVSKLF